MENVAFELFSDRYKNNNLKKSEIFQYLLPNAKWSDLEKTHFLLVKMQKMNIRKHTGKQATRGLVNLFISDSKAESYYY